MGIRKVLIYLIAFLACSHVFAQDYEIRMTRAAETGERYELIASGSSSEQMTMSSQGRVLRKNKIFISAKLEGIVTVLEVDELKQEKKLSLLVSKSLMYTNVNDKEEEALPKGTQVIAQRRDGKKEFLIDGKIANEDIAKMLDIFITIPATQVTDDDIFGTKERKNVGDSWAVNNVNALKDLASDGIVVDLAKMEGSAKLERIVEVEGIKCLLLSASIEINGVAPPLPSGLTVEKSNVSAILTGEYPIDISIRPFSQIHNMTMAFVAKGKLKPDAPEVALSLDSSKSGNIKARLIN
jgi:hypothetical protein